jgi:hypothetical protein
MPNSTPTSSEEISISNSKSNATQMPDNIEYPYFGDILPSLDEVTTETAEVFFAGSDRRMRMKKPKTGILPVMNRRGGKAVSMNLRALRPLM